MTLARTPKNIYLLPNLHLTFDFLTKVSIICSVMECFTSWAVTVKFRTVRVVEFNECLSVDAVDNIYSLRFITPMERA